MLDTCISQKSMCMGDSLDVLWLRWEWKLTLPINIHYDTNPMDATYLKDYSYWVYLTNSLPVPALRIRAQW